MSLQLHEWDIHIICFGMSGDRVIKVTNEKRPGSASGEESQPQGEPDGKAAVEGTVGELPGASEPKGRGVAWTEERGTSDEGRQRLKAPPEASEP